MADFRNMNRGGPPQHMMRPVGPPMMPQGPAGPGHIKPPGPGPIAPFPSLCPDFLKGVCSVFQCPKNHPEASLLFCKAYQRDMCQHAQSCSYMHATVEEEQYYKDTGLIPLRFMNQPIRMERGKGPLSNGQPSLFPSDTSATNAPANNPASTPTIVPEVPPPFNAAPQIVPEPEITNNAPLADKHKMDSLEPPPQQIKRQKLSYEELEIELNMMKEKVKVLEKKVDQLDAANDVLLEKNAKLRGPSRRSRERRSPEKRDSDRGSRHSRRDRRSRSRERGRSKETSDRDWKDSSRGGSRWNDQQYSNNNSHANNNNFSRAM